MNLQRAIDSFFAWLLPRKLAATSLEAYRQDLQVVGRFLAAFHGKSSLVDLSTDDLTKEAMRSAFADYAVDHGKASILRSHSTWRQFFDFLVADGVVDGNPMAAVNRPKSDERKPKPLDGWDEDTVDRLFVSLVNGQRGGRDPWPELDVAVVGTLLATGARRSELLAMNLDALEGQPGSQVIRVVGKGAKPRSIPVESTLDLILGRYLETRKARHASWKAKADDPLFVSPRRKVVRLGGDRLSARQLHYLLDQSLRAAGLANRRHKGAMAHAFRHTYGTTLAADGAPVAAIRKLMGHSSINTSQGYIESLAREERDVAAQNRVYRVLDELYDNDSE
jgi:integrase/recombinase XerD